MQLPAQPETRMQHLDPQYLADVRQSCHAKLSQEQYDYIIRRIEGAVDITTRSMMNAYDRGHGFLKLAIHPGSTQASMSIIYEKVIKQTPWKYRRTVLGFVEAIDTLFKFASGSNVILEKFQTDRQVYGNRDAMLEAISELTINYIVKLIEQEKTYLAS